MKKQTNTMIFNDSDIGYFDEYFVEEVRKEIRETLAMIKQEEQECQECNLEYDSKKGMYSCSNCGKKIGS